MSKTISQELSNFITNLQYSDLPDDVKLKAKLSLLDNLGVIIRAWQEKNVLSVLNVIKNMKGSHESTILVYGDKVPVMNAAFCNATMCHSLELDDHMSHKRNLSHPGVVSIPPALAVGEYGDIDGETLILAIVIGYEITSRINNAVKPGFFNLERGFHGTGICGTFGAAALSGKLLGIDSDKIAIALGIAGSLTSGSLEYKSNGAWTKRLHAGNSSKNGILAAMLAKNGHTGPYTVFEGKYGFYNEYAGKGNYDLFNVTNDLGKDYEIRYIQYKPFACSGVLHSPLTAAKMILKENNINSEDIDCVEIFTSKKLINVYAEPKEIRTFPKTTVDAQFSLIYSVAALICQGNALIDVFTEEMISNKEILGLAQKIRCYIDPEIDRVWPNKEPSKVIIKMKDGRVLKKSVEAAKGSFENPLSEIEIKDKFYLLTKNIIKKEFADKIIFKCLNLEQLTNIKELINLIQVGKY